MCCKVHSWKTVVADRVCSRTFWKVIEYRMRRILVVGTYVMLLPNTTFACPVQVQLVGGDSGFITFYPTRKILQPGLCQEDSQSSWCTPPYQNSAEPVSLLTSFFPINILQLLRNLSSSSRLRGNA
jgi:hypothetical protein